MELLAAGVQEVETGVEKHGSELQMPTVFPVSPYALHSSAESPTIMQRIPVAKTIISTPAIIPARHDLRGPAAAKCVKYEPKLKAVVKMVSSSATSARLQKKNEANPTLEFQKEESKMLAIVCSQESTTAAFVQMNSFADGDSTISLRELGVWLPIYLPRLDNAFALKLAIKNAKKLRCLQESRVGTRELLLAKLHPPDKDEKKGSVEIEELPSFFLNLLAYHRIAKLVSAIDPSGELKLTRLEVFLFLSAIRVSSSSEIGKGVIQKVGKTGCISFAELCRISLELGFVSFCLHESNAQLASKWDFSMKQPDPKPPIVRRIKTREEVRSEMLSKILKQTRDQDLMSSSVVPYMVLRTTHHTPHTLHLTPHTSHLTHRTSHIAHHNSHLTPHTSHLTPHISHLTHHTSHLTSHT
jgi:hypothetical protein